MMRCALLAALLLLSLSAAGDPVPPEQWDSLVDELESAFRKNRSKVMDVEFDLTLFYRSARSQPVVAETTEEKMDFSVLRSWEVEARLRPDHRPADVDAYKLPWLGSYMEAKVPPVAEAKIRHQLHFFPATGQWIVPRMQTLVSHEENFALSKDPADVEHPDHLLIAQRLQFPRGVYYRMADPWAAFGLDFEFRTLRERIKGVREQKSAWGSSWEMSVEATEAEVVFTLNISSTKRLEDDMEATLVIDRAHGHLLRMQERGFFTSALVSGRDGGTYEKSRVYAYKTVTTNDGVEAVLPASLSMEKSFSRDINLGKTGMPEDVRETRTTMDMDVSYRQVGGSLFEEGHFEPEAVSRRLGVRLGLIVQGQLPEWDAPDYLVSAKQVAVYGPQKNTGSIVDATKEQDERLVAHPLYVKFFKGVAEGSSGRDLYNAPVEELMKTAW